ncbi:MAG: hypothetical protein U9N32_02395 [Spirochaetota bacterium]|nr:hypothetical protein [Spirochaetota bacterium]
MKSTDIARSDRELKRARKKAEYIESKLNRDSLSVADYINQLHEMMFFDAQKVYGISENEDILMKFVEMRDDQPEKQWETIIKKAVRKTKVVQKEEAIKELMELLEFAE